MNKLFKIKLLLILAITNIKALEEGATPRAVEEVDYLCRQESGGRCSRQLSPQEMKNVLGRISSSPYPDYNKLENMTAFANELINIISELKGNDDGDGEFVLSAIDTTGSSDSLSSIEYDENTPFSTIDGDLV